jgi:hypothetical protein
MAGERKSNAAFALADLLNQATPLVETPASTSPPSMPLQRRGPAERTLL